MRTYFKYLIICWSIICTALFFYLVKIMKIETTETKYVIHPMKEGNITTKEIMDLEISPPPGFVIDKDSPLTTKELRQLERNFELKNDYYALNLIRLLKEKGVEIEFKQGIKDAQFAVLFITFAFIVWAIPIVVFSLLGLMFGRSKT